MFEFSSKRQPQPRIYSKDNNLTVNEDSLAIPGKVLNTNSDFMRGHGTYFEDGILYSSVAGITDQVNKLLRVKTLKPRYSGEVGDVVVGRIVEVQANRWMVDINSSQFAVLLLSNVNLPGGELRRKKTEDQLLMTDYMKVGDLVSAEAQRTYTQGYLGLHTRSMKYGKLGQGILVKVSPALVKRRKAHFFNLPIGASIILGCNGYIWISDVKNLIKEESESGGYIQPTESVGVETRKVIARLANCVKALARNFIPLTDTTITFAYEASLTHEISDLIDPQTADQLAQEVLFECKMKEVEIMNQLNPNCHVSVSVHSKELILQLGQFLKTAFADHLTNEPDQPFVIGYSGGSMPKTLILVLEEAIDPHQRSKIRLFPVDERLVPLEHADNNTNVYLKGLPHVFHEEQFAVLPSTVLDNGEEAAEFLRSKLAEWSGTSNEWPRINVLFLGMGPDGHTCSLFPNHPLLKEEKKWTAAIEDSPKPPPRRVTITVPVVNAAQHVAFIILGEEKAEILKKIIIQKSTEFPVGLIKLKNGKPVHFFLDDKAASKVVSNESGNESVKIIGHL